MSIKVEVGGSNENFNFIEKGERGFIIKGSSGEEIEFETPLVLDPGFKHKNFEVHFLVKKNVKESEIYEVHSKTLNGRIGWIIPAISLNSNSHDYVDNSHFLKYAYMAVRESLANLNSNFFSYPISGNGQYFTLLDVFHEDTVLLVLSKETYNKDFLFNKHRSSPSLMRHGYMFLSDQNPSRMHHEIKEIYDLKKIVIEEISDALNSHLLISNILNSSFPYEKNSAFKFFLLYQIFELLIDSVYQNKQSSLIDNLIRDKGNLSKTKDSIKDLKDLASDKKRLGMLVSEYTKCQGKLIPLKNSCNNLLTNLDKERNENFDEYFYKIRNFIFHQYRDFPQGCEDLLAEVIEEVIIILPTILNSYK